MNRSTGLPLQGHALAWLLLIVISIAGTLGTPVSADTRPPAPTLPDTAGCYAWKTKHISQTFQPAVGTRPTIYLNFTVKYNGCDVVRVYGRCSANVIVMSVKFTWCGFYQAASWNNDKLQFGANWTECLLPLHGFGPCYDDYWRVTVDRHGRTPPRYPWNK